MKLSDFYFEEKAQIGNRMPILLPNGTDSGEWLNVVSADADAAVKAGRAFAFKYKAAVESLKTLETKAKKAKDYTEYNIALGEACEVLNRQLSAEIVNGWSFDEPFSKEAIVKLLDQYKALGTLVVDFYRTQRDELQAK